MHHHNALDDTKACFEILRKFEAEYPEEIRPELYLYGNAEKSNFCGKSIEEMYNEKTRTMQKLQQIVMEIIEDNNISDKDICELKEWLEKHEELKGYYPFDKILKW